MNFKNKSTVIAKSTPVALATALTALLMNGCIWDSGLYDTYARDGKLEICNEDGTNKDTCNVNRCEMEYVLLENDYVCTLNEDKDVFCHKNGNENEMCEDENESNCIRFVNNRVFDYFLCPGGYKCGNDNNDKKYCYKSACVKGKHENSSGVCEPDSLKACGSESNNCESISGWLDGECRDGGVCFATACKESEGYLLDKVKGKCESGCNVGEHLYNKNCEADSLENCGSHENDCTKVVSGWKSGNCIESKCVATSCDEASGYQFKDGKCESGCKDGEHLYQRTCEPNSIENCGSHGNNCKKIPGWIQGDCSNGECIASECNDEGYKLKDGKCEALIECPDNHHFYSGKCEEDSLQNCGSHENDCTSLGGWDTGECRDGKCYAENCKDYNNQSYENIDGKCTVITGCEGDKNKYYDEGVCKDNSMYNCGVKDNDCTLLAGWNSGDCVEGQCSAESCTEYNGQSYELKKQLNGDAEIGVCTVITGCGGDKNKYYDNGVCKDNDLSNCGIKGNDCTSLAGWKEGDCVEGQCSAKSCTEFEGQSYDLKKHMDGELEIGICAVITGCGGDKNKYYDNGVCKDNNVDNCGIKDYSCASLPGWATGACVEGKCLASECKEYGGQSYEVKSGVCTVITGCKGDKNKYYDNGICKDNNTENCGVKDYSCSSLSGWKTGSCTEGKCIAETCKDYNGQSYEVKNGVCTVITGCKGDKNKYYDDGVCKANDLSNCGSKGNACTSLPGWNSGRCTEGKCIAESCRDYNNQSYEVKSGVCTVITGCGGDKNKYYDNGVCKTNDLSNCGSKGNSCTSLPGWNTGSCTEGKCVAESCKEYNNQSYEVKGGVCTVITGCGGNKNKYYDNGVCKDNDLSNCGAKGLSCGSNAPQNSVANSCVEGVCNYKCSDGFKNVGSNLTANLIDCIDPDTNGEHCGAVGNPNGGAGDTQKGINCSSDDNSTGVCSSSKCVCKGGYRWDSTSKQCVVDSNSCVNTSDCRIDNAKTQTCNSNNKCTVQVCRPGFKPSDDASSCGVCGQGYYSSAGVECTRCAADYYTDVAGQSSCKKCPEGASDSENHTACVCNDDNAQFNSGKTECICKKNYYGDGTTCTVCPSGSTSNAGSSVCTCNNGHAQMNNNNSACICKSNYYGDGIKCNACPSGSTSNAGSTSIGDCSCNNEHAQLNNSACICKSNYYGDGTTCTACPDGTTSNAGSTSIGDCKCNNEHAQLNGDNSACICKKNYYGDGTTCTACPAGSVSNAGSASCACDSANDYYNCGSNGELKCLKLGTGVEPTGCDTNCADCNAGQICNLENGGYSCSNE